MMVLGMYIKRFRNFVGTSYEALLIGKLDSLVAKIVMIKIILCWSNEGCKMGFDHLDKVKYKHTCTIQ